MWAHTFRDGNDSILKECFATGAIVILLRAAGATGISLHWNIAADTAWWWYYEMAPTLLIVLLPLVTCLAQQEAHSVLTVIAVAAAQLEMMPGMLGVILNSWQVAA